MVSMGARHTGDLGFDSLLRHFFVNLNQHLALTGPPGGHTVWANGLSTTSCDSLIDKPVDTLFVHHHQTSTKLVAKRDGGSTNKPKTFGGPTMGEESNHELDLSYVPGDLFRMPYLNSVLFSGFKQQQPTLPGLLYYPFLWQGYSLQQNVKTGGKLIFRNASCHRLFTLYAESVSGNSLVFSSF